MILCKLALFTLAFDDSVWIGEWPKVQILSSLLWFNDFSDKTGKQSWKCLRINTFICVDDLT